MLTIGSHLDARERSALEEMRRAEIDVANIVLAVRGVDEACLDQIRARAPALRIRERNVAAVEALRRIQQQLAIAALTEADVGSRKRGLVRTVVTIARVRLEERILALG